jgi:glycosyltransferase involved in cell wall biosynthesis
MSQQPGSSTPPASAAVSGSHELISIVLPTFNRAAFLPSAFESIRAQTYRHWELVVVDDGSTDETTAVLDRLAAESPRPFRVVRQANAGAYAARNTGLDHSTGTLVAFFDSDDLWLPHHLEDCARALAAHAEVDWVFGACRVEDMASGRELEPTTFAVNGRPRPFLSLHTRRDGALAIIDDERAVEMQIRHGLFCGLQNSVIRRSVFSTRRFWSDYQVVEDDMFVIRLLAEGGRFAYYDKPHVVYRIHGQNSSGSAVGQDVARNRRIFSEMTRGLERVAREATLDARSRRALAERLARERFWGLGYSAHWLAGDGSRARAAYRQALAEWPWSAPMWKTFLMSYLRRPPAAASR